MRGGKTKNEADDRQIGEAITGEDEQNAQGP
jgi:hypothetical protein